MQTIIAILLFILLVVAIMLFVEIRSARKEAVERENEAVYNQYLNEANLYNSGNESQIPDTYYIMTKVLSNLGCNPKVNEDGIMSVQYQGENFNMEFGGAYVRVWDPMWAKVKANNPDLPKIREAVNLANFNFGPTVVMTAPDELGIIGFYSRRDIMLHHACPDNEPFIKEVLDSFFVAKEQFLSNYKQIRTEQEETPNSRRPVGFATDNQP